VLELTAMKRRQATIDDVAARAGLSIKTVSRVFNREPNVRPQTRDRVLTAAKDLEYQPNVSARRLASKRSFVIGLLYDDPESDYVKEIQDGALEVCRHEGYHVLIHPCRANAPDLVDEVVGLYRRSTVDGFILTQPLSDVEPLIAALLGLEIGIVRISQRTGYGGCHCVSVDDEAAAHRMTDHLISLGHRSIGFILGQPEHGSSHDRLAGYRASLSTHGVRWDSGVVIQGRYTFESGYSSAQQLLALHPRPTAVFASNDHMAMGVLKAAHERGIDVPADLSVCGFDDTPMARYAWPPLTTVRQPIKRVARVATECLVGCLGGEESQQHRHVLESKLVLRESTADCARCISAAEV
jgi:LacI family transcriptional regulator